MTLCYLMKPTTPLLLVAICLLAGVLGSTSVPAQGPVTPQAEQARHELGKRLFEETKLSTDGTVACATCHLASHAFTDGRAVAIGVRKQLGVRNAQSLLNVGHQSSFFWDGRKKTLEEQVLDPLVNPIEHGFASHADVLAILNGDAGYVAAFRRSFPEMQRGPIEAPHLAAALASFVRSLVSPESAIDRFVIKRDAQAMNAEARAGFEVFNKALCVGCHTVTPDRYSGRVLLTDDRFHASGATAISMRPSLEAFARSLIEQGVALASMDASTTEVLGRFVVTGNVSDAGAFKTPSLRNVSKTGPYFHDGSAPTLESAVERELVVSTGSINLSAQERQQLLAFLRALDDDAPATTTSSQPGAQNTRP
ncbi:MAG: cytochrome c peroxidase [Burkholderiales bacterium]